MLDPSDAIKLVFQNKRNADFASLLSSPESPVWELIFDSIPEMVALIDLNNIVVKANKAMQQRLNTGDQSLTGHSCNSLMHDYGCSLSNCPHIHMINDRKAHSIELFEPKFSSYLNISTTPIFDADNNLLGSLHIARDITIQKESEAKLTKYNSELKELNQSKDKFFSIVAHDLRSPFQGMLGFTDLILDELPSLSKDEIREYLQKVRDSSYNTLLLLENLLDWSRMQTGRLQYNPSVFNAGEDVSGIISLLDSSALSKKISMINNLSSDYMVYADRRMVHSILLNLATNAIKFSYPGGTVNLNERVIQASENTSADKDTLLGRKYMEISVSDTGVGMSPEVLNQITATYDYFSLAGTAKEQGAGLGLLLVKEMTEMQGGKLTISSQEGKGSVFAFTLPLAEK
jgi:PAS domain S-box-containing protein